MRILLLEDDALIGDGLVNGLKFAGMTVDWFQGGQHGLAALSLAPYDAVVLDLGLPEIDGMDVLAQWRRKGLDTPVLILTARDALANRVAGLNAGADDYLIKPFALEEVTARLQALVRRSQGRAQAVIQYGGLQFDAGAQTATLHGQILDLTARELTLLGLLLSHKGRVLTRAMIEDKLYGWQQEVESNAVEVYISHLRKKIGSQFIRTQRGLGYSLGEAP